jgi:hypothetical protein
VERDIANKRYTNQLIRVRSQDGRFKIEAANLDASGKVTGTPREIRDVNWRYLRESGPFRRLVKEEVSRMCEGQRACTERAYKAAKLELETTGNMNQAMRRATEQIQLPATTASSPKATTANSQAPIFGASRVRQSSNASRQQSLCSISLLRGVLPLPPICVNVH